MHVVLVEQPTPVAAEPPKLNAVAPGVVSKPAPVKVTVVPPACGPDVGEIDVKLGGGGAET